MKRKKAPSAHGSDNRVEGNAVVENKRAELESILLHLWIATIFCVGITIVTMLRDDQPGTIAGAINQLMKFCASFGLAGGLAIILGLYLKLKSMPSEDTREKANRSNV